MEINMIVSYCLELNENINTECTIKKSKYIKLIHPLIELQKNIRKNKLIKTINKLANGNEPLKSTDMLDYFNKIYNNYIPDGSYGIIQKIKMVYDNAYLKAYMVIDNIRAIITIDFNKAAMNNKKPFDLEIRIKNDDKFNSYLITITKLSTTNPDIKDVVYKINRALYKDMSRYLVESIRG